MECQFLFCCPCYFQLCLLEPLCYKWKLTIQTAQNHSSIPSKDLALLPRAQMEHRLPQTTPMTSRYVHYFHFPFGLEEYLWQSAYLYNNPVISKITTCLWMLRTPLYHAQWRVLTLGLHLNTSSFFKRIRMSRSEGSWGPLLLRNGEVWGHLLNYNPHVIISYLLFIHANIFYHALLKLCNITQVLIHVLKKLQFI